MEKVDVSSSKPRFCQILRRVAGARVCYRIRRRDPKESVIEDTSYRALPR